jgi:aspartyl-tRNA(Asn)/glutamyl-tRNA(Gln) amidotransferase subunit C
MASTLTEDDVRRIAALAHLELLPDEVVRFSEQLANILHYADDIAAANTTGIEPTSHPFASGPIWRSDDPVRSLNRDVVLSQAPAASRQAGLFKVPKVL